MKGTKIWADMRRRSLFTLRLRRETVFDIIARREASALRLKTILYSRTCSPETVVFSRTAGVLFTSERKGETEMLKKLEESVYKFLNLEVSAKTQALVLLGVMYLALFSLTLSPVLFLVAVAGSAAAGALALVIGQNDHKQVARDDFMKGVQGILTIVFGALLKWCSWPMEASPQWLALNLLSAVCVMLGVFRFGLSQRKEAEK